MELHKEEIIPVKWTGWNEIGPCAITIYNAKFIEDFGIFKKDESYSQLNIYYDKGYIEYYMYPDIIKVQYFKATPTNVQENNIL